MESENWLIVYSPGWRSHLSLSKVISALGVFVLSCKKCVNERSCWVKCTERCIWMWRCQLRTSENVGPRPLQWVTDNLLALSSGAYFTDSCPNAIDYPIIFQFVWPTVPISFSQFFNMLREYDLLLFSLILMDGCLRNLMLYAPKSFQSRCYFRIETNIATTVPWAHHNLKPLQSARAEQSLYLTAVQLASAILTFLITFKQSAKK